MDFKVSKITTHIKYLLFFFIHSPFTFQIIDIADYDNNTLPHIRIYIYTVNTGALKMTSAGVNRRPHPQVLKLHPRV